MRSWRWRGERSSGTAICTGNDRDISAIIAVGSRRRYRSICVPGLDRAGLHRRITVTGAPSMAEAWEVGRRLAATPWALYLHDDTELLVSDAAQRIVRTLTDLDVGAVAGAAGCQTLVLPWWSGHPLTGRVAGSPVAAPVLSPTRVALLDGVVMAQSTDSWPWAPMQGWHGYDSTRCLEAAARGVSVIVAPELECRHISRWKGDGYHRAHIGACHRIARWWGIPCAYPPP